MRSAAAPVIGDGGRLVVAFGLSVACHAVLALAFANGLRIAARGSAPLLVTVVERGDGGAAAALAPGLPQGDDALAAAAPPVPLAASAETRRAPALPPRQRGEDRHARPAAPSIRAPRAATRSDQAADAGAAAAGETSASAVSGLASVPVAGVGESSGHGLAGGDAGRGRGAAAGEGGDGLRAFCRDCPTPDYPTRARRQRWQGTVDVALTIGGDGGVTAARVERSSGYPALDDTALAVARRSRFVVPDGGEGLRGELRYRFVLDESLSQRGAP